MSSEELLDRQKKSDLLNQALKHEPQSGTAMPIVFLWVFGRNQNKREMGGVGLGLVG